MVEREREGDDTRVHAPISALRSCEFIIRPPVFFVGFSVGSLAVSANHDDPFLTYQCMH